MAEKILDLFEHMSVTPDNVIYMIIFKACTQLANERSVATGKKLLNQISNELPMNIDLSNSALHMLVRFSDIQGAERVFRSIKDKNVVTYGIMMQGNDLSYQLHLQILI